MAMPSRRQENVCRQQRTPLTKAHGYNKPKVLVWNINSVITILQQLPKLWSVYHCISKNIITTEHFKANTPLSSKGVTVLHYGMKSVSQLFLGNEVLFLNPLSLSLSLSLQHRLLKTSKTWKQKYFQQMLVPTRMY